ncbi:MAG: hypothetical protein ACRDCW_14735, partial [Sarcina sp.]
MKNLENYKQLIDINNTLTGELNYSLYISGIAYESWFDKSGLPIMPLPLAGMTYNFSTSLAEDFTTVNGMDRQIVLHWDDQKTFFYKGLMIVGDEVMYVDTTIMKSKPSSYYGKLAIPVVDIDGNIVIQRGVNGTRACNHKVGRFCRSAVNFTDKVLDIGYNDNAELSESKPFSPVVSSGTVGIDIEPIEWGNSEVNGEKNVYKVYEMNNRLPVYCFVGTRLEKVCEFVAFTSSFNLMPTKSKIEIRIADKTSLYWSEEIKKSYQFMGTSLIDAISILFNYDKSMVRYPNNSYKDSDFMTISNVNTNKYKYYKDIMQELSKELMFRMSFDSNEEIVIQSEIMLMNKTKNPTSYDDIIASGNYFNMTDIENIFDIERSTSSSILYNKIDTDIVEYKPFYDGSFFELSSESSDAIYPVKNAEEGKQLAERLINNNESHRRYIYDTSASKLYMASYEYVNGTTQTIGMKHIPVNNKETCSLDEAKKYKNPIKYKFSKQLTGLRILDRTIDKQELIFNTVVVKLPKTEAEMLDPYGRENGEYVIMFDGENDFHGRVIDIKVLDKDYYDVTIVFGYDKDYDYNFKGKTDYLSNYRKGDFFISYENKHDFVMYYVRKELPYVWQYSRGDKVSNVNVPIFGNDTFEVWGDFGGIDTDDGKFAKLVDDIDNIYDNIYCPSFQNEFTQYSPVYLRSMMVGEYVSDDINSMYITEFNNKNIIMQILRSKPTEDLPKNTLITGMSNKNNNSSDLYVRVTTKLHGSTVRLNVPTKVGNTMFPVGSRFVTISIDSDEAKRAKITEKDLFEYYIVKVDGKAEKVYKEYAETVAPTDKSRNEVFNTFGKTMIVGADVYQKVKSGDILTITEPTENEKQDPEIMMLYHKYKDARWMVRSKLYENNEYVLFLDYEFPKKMKFDIFGGYIYGSPALSGYVLLQELSIKGNPILEYKQRYYYENAESVAKYGDRAYNGFSGKLMPTIAEVNMAVSYIVNGFSGIGENNQKMVMPITTSHIVGLDMLDTMRVIDRVYGTYDKIGILVGKDFSVNSSSGIKYNLKVFTIEQYTDSAYGSVGSVSTYKPIEFPVFGYKDGDGGWESTGNSLTKTDTRVGEVKFKRIDGSLFSATTSRNFYEGKEIHMALNSPTEAEMSNKDFSEIFKAGSDLIIEVDGVKHLITMTKVDRATNVIIGDLKLKNLFENSFEEQVLIPSGEILGLYQTITVIDEISSIVDRVDVIEKETEDNFGDDGVLGDNKPAKPLNFRLEPAVNGFVVKLNHPDSKNIKGYNIYYRMIGRITEDEAGNSVIVPPEDNVERVMFTSATLTFVAGVGKRKYEVYMRSISHKGHVSDPTIILNVETRVLGFDDVYYPPGQSPDELDQARKDLADKLGQQIDILEKADDYLRGQYGSITEDLEKNYYTKVDTDEQFSIGFGKVQETVLDQSKKYTDTQFGVVDGKINASVSELNEKYTEMGGEIDWAKAQLNMTKESITTLVKDVKIEIDGANKKIDDNYSEFIQTSDRIETVVGSLETRVDDAEITIKEETTKINQKADAIELVAKRTEAKVDKQALVGSNYIYNSGDFSTGKKVIKDLDGKEVEEIVKDDTNPLYWNNINPNTAYPCAVYEDTDGTKNIRIPHTEGISHDGIFVPGGTTYYCTATVKMDSDFQSNAFEPINIWVSSILDPKVEGEYGTDYEFDILGTHLEKVTDPDTGVTTDVVVKDTFPTVGGKDWVTVKIKVILKGSTANKMRIVPRVKTNVPTATSILLKNIQFRMGEEYKTWEPSLEQALDPVNIVSMINITPDEIKLDSKLIKIGGGIIVEGENVAINNLSAKRLQLGENFFYTEGDRDEEGNLIPDTERLIITKMNVGQIEAINPALPDEHITIDAYIKGLDEAAKDTMRGELNDAKELLNTQIDNVNKKAEESLDSLKGMATDDILTGQEKTSVQTEYKTLVNRVRTMEENIRKRAMNEELFGTIILTGLGDKIYDDTKECSLNTYLINGAKLYERYPEDYPDQYKVGMLTTTSISSTEFDQKWKDAYAEEQKVLNDIDSVLNQLSERAEGQANAAQKVADNAKLAADTAKEMTNKANLKAAESMQNVSKAVDDNFLSAAEKSQMEIDWIELRDSANSIEVQVLASNYKDDITTLALLKKKITGSTEGSLYSYLSSDETKFFNLSAFEEEDVELEEADEVNPGGTVTTTRKVKVYGTKLKDDLVTAEKGGAKFTRMWKGAYDARQSVLNEITKVSDIKMKEAQDQALLSVYGQYDPYFRQHANISPDHATLWLYSFKSDGDGKTLLSDQKIVNTEGFYMINSGEYKDNAVLRVNGSKTIYWKNPVKIDSNIHYRLTSRMKSANVLRNVSIGIVCMDGNYKELGRVTAPLKQTALTWEDVSIFITSIADSQNTEYRFIKDTMYVRPFLSVTDGIRDNYTLFQSLEFLDCQDEINQSNIVDIFSDNKITPDEKKELSRTMTEIKEDKKKIDTLVQFPTFKDKIDAVGATENESKLLTKYYSAYDVVIRMLGEILDPSLPDIIEYSQDDRLVLNRITGEYYSS